MDLVNLDSASGGEDDTETKPRGGEESAPKVVDRRRIQVDEDGNPAEALEDAEPRKPTYIEELENKVVIAEEKLKERIERLDRESTEFRARQERELERRTKQAKKDAVSAFLGITDDLGRATFAATESLGDPAKSRETLDALVQGVRMIQGRFFQELATLGVKPFVSKGEKFDPERHSAVRTVAVSEPVQEGMVMDELTQGYLLGDEVLRTSTVAVGKYSSPS